MVPLRLSPVLLVFAVLDAMPLAVGDGGRAIAVAGGGWRSYSVASATTAAMLHELRRTNEGAGLEDLFSGVEALVTNSGGSWFGASLIWSTYFGELVRAMAADPSSAGVIFNDGWTARLLSNSTAAHSNVTITATTADQCLLLLADAMSVAHSGAELLESQWPVIEAAVVDFCVANSRVQKGARVKCQSMVNLALSHKQMELSVLMEKVNEALQAAGIPWLQDYWQVVYIYSHTGGMSWADIVEASLEKTVNLDADVTMGSDPQPWARGKTWIAATSIPTPPTNGSAGRVFYIESLNITNSSTAIDETLSYSVESGFGETLWQYVPAHFSIVLGGGEDAQSPYPFCASEDCFALSRSIQSGLGEDATDLTSFSGGGSFKRAFSDSSGRLPVSYVAASSSSALSAGVLSSYTAWAASNGCIDLTVWASDAAGGGAFSAGQAALDGLYASADEASVSALAEQKVTALFDGAYTDNTGIAWAVAGGASEVTLISQGDPSDIWRLGSGGPSTWGVGVFGGVNFPIFGQTSQEIQAEYEAMPSLQIPASADNTPLESIVWGSMILTTVDNKWFGIQGGRQVKVNVIQVNSEGISMAGLSDFWLYGTLVGSITSTFAYEANAEDVRTILNDFFAPTQDANRLLPDDKWLQTGSLPRAPRAGQWSFACPATTALAALGAAAVALHRRRAAPAPAGARELEVGEEQSDVPINSADW